MVALVEITDDVPTGWMLAADRDDLLAQLRATNAPAIALVEALPEDVWRGKPFLGPFHLGPNREGNLWLLLERDA